jgi:hypothetical protein
VRAGDARPSDGDNWSFARDLTLIARTVPVVLGARRAS